MKKFEKPYCYVTATNEYPPLLTSGGKTLKNVVSCDTAKQALQVESRMKKKGYYKYISRSKNKPYYDPKHYATRYSIAAAWLKH